MKEFVVFYRTSIARLKGTVVAHVYVNAHTAEEALKEAEPLLNKHDAILFAQESPAWEVTK